MNEEELKKEIEKWSRGCNVNIDFPKGLKYCDGINLCKVCKTNLDLYEAELKGFQKGKLEEKKEGLFIMNGSNVDLRICETEAISEDEDEINQIGVIKSGCGLRVYPKDNSIYIEQLQKEIGEEKQDDN